jgi:hypothetical protein
VKLPSGERSIFAYFPSPDLAQKAATALKDAGFHALQIDRISRHGAEANASLDNPLNRSLSIAGITIYSDGGETMSDSERVLLASGPSSSGYGNPEAGIAGGKAFLLTLVTPEERVAEAVRIIKNHGGEV